MQKEELENGFAAKENEEKDLLNQRSLSLMKRMQLWI